MIASKKYFPEPGDRFTHKTSGLTFLIVAFNPTLLHVTVRREDRLESVKLSLEVFFCVFRKFGEYDEKDLV